MLISDWSSDLCSSDLAATVFVAVLPLDDDRLVLFLGASLERHGGLREFLKSAVAVGQYQGMATGIVPEVIEYPVIFHQPRDEVASRFEVLQASFPGRPTARFEVGAVMFANWVAAVNCTNPIQRT